MPEEMRKKISIANKGRKPPNTHIFNNEQIEIMLDLNRSACGLAREFGVTAKVIDRIRKEHKKS